MSLLKGDQPKYCVKISLPLSKESYYECLGKFHKILHFAIGMMLHGDKRVGYLEMYFGIKLMILYKAEVESICDGLIRRITDATTPMPVFNGAHWVSAMRILSV